MHRILQGRLSQGLEVMTLREIKRAERQPFEVNGLRLTFRASWPHAPRTPLKAPMRWAHGSALIGPGHEDRAVSRSPRSEGSLSACRRGGDSNHAD